MVKNYKITNETTTYKGKTLYRIEALKDLGLVKKGDKGGFIESEKNLSQNGTCWVGRGSIVCDNARVEGDAMVCGQRDGDGVIVEENAVIKDEAVVSLWGRVYGDAIICGQAHVNWTGSVGGKAIIKDKAVVHGFVIGEAVVGGRSKVNKNSLVYGSVVLSGTAEVKGEVAIFEGNYTKGKVQKGW